MSVECALIAPGLTVFAVESEPEDASRAAANASAHGVAVHVIEGRAPEVDGRAGLLAVAGVWAVAESRALGGFVQIADIADGTISSVQDPIDAAIGLLTKAS